MSNLSGLIYYFWRQEDERSCEFFFFFTALYSPNLTESARSNLFKVPVRVDFKLSSILSQKSPAWVNFIKKDGQKVESKLFNTSELA